MEDRTQPIIIKKITVGGHHGGAWKVAYADFVTAMMAFFLLLWLLGTTDQEERGGISEWFQNPSAVQGPGGASTSMIDLGGSLELPRASSDMDVETEPQPDAQDAEDAREPTPEELAAAEAARERERMQTLMQELEDAIGLSQALKPYKDHLLLDITPEGLRIQIVDKENRSMFDIGSDELKPYTIAILDEIADIINGVPNRISISGHTDIRPFVRRDYTNWELSTDRANAARRALVTGGLNEDKLARVVGLSSAVLFDKLDPYNAINRRISIVVMNRDADEAIERVETYVSE
jgi:chemotaxis protein MotB